MPGIEKTLNVLGEWSRLVTPLGVVALLFLNTMYVTKGEFSAALEKADSDRQELARSVELLADITDKRLRAVEDVLIRMEAEKREHERFSKTLEDHEQRIRAIEQR